MRLTPATLAACILAVVLTSGGAWAQAPNQPDAVATLRGRDTFSPQDRAAVETWIRNQVQALVTAAKAGDSKALAAPRRNLLDAAVGQGATEPFRMMYAEGAASVFRVHFNDDNPLLALHLVQILGSLRQPSSLDAVLKALESKHAAVRYWAAKAIRSIRDQIVRLPNEPGRTIQALTRAGAQEGDPAAAQMMYEALDFRAVPGAPPNAPSLVAAALLEVLNGRLQFYGSEVVTEFYPDAYALDVLQNMSQSAGDLSDADRRRAVQLALTIMADAVDRWVLVARVEETLAIAPENPYDSMSVRDWHLRYQLAKVALEAEDTIRRLAPAGSSFPPGAADLMISLSTADKVRAAFEKWRDLVQPPAPATASAPAPTAP